MRSDQVIAITGLQAGYYPAPGIEVAKSLALVKPNIRLKILGIDYDPLCSGLSLKSLFYSTHVLCPADNLDSIVNALQVLVEACGLEILIPNLDVDVGRYAFLKGQLEKIGIKVYLPTRKSLSLIQKENLQVIVDGIGQSYPSTEIIRTKKNLVEFIRNCKVPVVIKGNSSGAFAARERQAVLIYAEKAVSLYGWPVIVQQFIKGAEYSIMAVSDDHSRVRGCASIKKMGVTDDGKTWSAVTIDCSQFVAIMQKLATATRWIGPFEIDVIVEEFTGKLHIIEFNPRFPSWVNVAAQAGANLPELLVDLINGEGPNHMVMGQSGLCCSLELTDIIGDTMSFLGSDIHIEEGARAVYRKL